MSEISELVFLGEPVETVQHDGALWLTCQQVWQCLGFADEQRSITRLYKRHANEFCGSDTTVVNLTTVTGLRDTRIFSQTGCMLIGMFATTQRAKAFRVWAKEVLAGNQSSRFSALPMTIKPAVRPKINRTIERQALELFAAGVSLWGISMQLGISKSAASQLVNGIWRFAPNAGPNETDSALIERVARRHETWECERIVQKFCASAANQALVEALDATGRRMVAALSITMLESQS